jgi:hypothetical protein
MEGSAAGSIDVLTGTDAVEGDVLTPAVAPGADATDGVSVESPPPQATSAMIGRTRGNRKGFMTSPLRRRGYTIEVRLWPIRSYAARIRLADDHVSSCRTGRLPISANPADFEAYGRASGGEAASRPPAPPALWRGAGATRATTDTTVQGVT